MTTKIQPLILLDKTPPPDWTNYYIRNNVPTHVSSLSLDAHTVDGNLQICATTSSPFQPSRHAKMSNWMPASFMRTFSTSAAAEPAPLEDAPLSALPACEEKALLALEAQLGDAVFSTAVLHDADPWRGLPDPHKRGLLLRFLRYQALAVDKAAAHVTKVGKWRADTRPWALPVEALRGAEAGLPMLEVGVRGRDGEVLMFGAARAYVKAEVVHARQEEAIMRMFEGVFYREDGPRGRAGVLVIDFYDLSYRNVDLVGTKNGIQLFLGYYPEMFRKILLINYPKWIYGTWKLVEPLLDGRTVAKIEWITTGMGLGMELEKYFAKGDIPRWLGGEGDIGEVKLYTGASVNVEEVARTLSA